MQKAWQKKYKVDFKGLNITGFKMYPYVRDASNYLKPIVGYAEIIDDQTVMITFKSGFPRGNYRVLNLVSEFESKNKTVRALLSLLVEKIDSKNI